MKFLLPIVLFALLTSCQKGIEDIDSPFRSTQIDSVVFSQFLELDTTAGAKPDTIEKLLFFYDNMKRLSHLDDYSYTSGVADPPSKITLYYSGNDTLPYKQVLVIQNNNGPADTVTNHYKFVNGKMLSDSSVSPVGSSINAEMRRYTYYPNRTVDTFLQYSTSPAQLAKGYENVSFQKVNGLIISQADSIVWGYDTPVSSKVGTATHIFSYDNNYNPFNILKPLYPYYTTEDNSSILSFEKNNVVEATQTFSSPFWGNANYHYKYAYEYNLSGYPTVVRITDQNNPSSVRKCLYFYK